VGRAPAGDAQIDRTLAVQVEIFAKVAEGALEDDGRRVSRRSCPAQPHLESTQTFFSPNQPTSARSSHANSSNPGAPPAPDEHGLAGLGSSEEQTHSPTISTTEGCLPTTISISISRWKASIVVSSVPARSHHGSGMVGAAQGRGRGGGREGQELLRARHSSREAADLPPIS